jgi:hypothetical protein
MLHDKMNAVIYEVCEGLAEREELVHTIALSLLTGKNLFVLGKPGQAKSQAIDLFRSHIQGAKQFDVLMSKGIDQEQLFGRLDLASIIPGHVSHSVLEKDEGYRKMAEYLNRLLEDAAKDTDSGNFLAAAGELQKKMETYRKCLAELHSGIPEMQTANKIPESHICFLDEIFKANDGVLNSLLKALNEHVYTNEGVSVKIPVISFFSASNEIPNFNNPEEKSLRALYDRFDFKVNTRYVQVKANRMRILKQKQQKEPKPAQALISLNELYAMQEEVRTVKVPDSINELADNILCELRRKDIPVSDRIYFNFSPVVQAEAWLHGRDTVTPADMPALVNYLWDKPEQVETVAETIRRLTENPLGDQIDAILAAAYQAQQIFEDAADKNHALLTLRGELLSAYEQGVSLKDGLVENDAAIVSVDGLTATLESISREAHAKTSFTYVPLEELKIYRQMSA